MTAREIAVFPAHAGMSRKRAVKIHRKNRFPRTRGDEPCVLMEWLGSSEFSPHTRG